MSASEALRRADAIAAGLNRGLRVQPLAWEELLAIAQQEIGRHQQRRLLDSSDELYDEQNATGLIAAARIVKYIAERDDEETGALRNEDSGANTSERERQLLLILASCVFSMYGNFPAAAAVQLSLDPLAMRTEGEWLAIVVSNPRQIAAGLVSGSIGSNARDFLERLNYFILGGDDQLGSKLIAHFEELMKAPRARAEIVFLRCARLALKHIITLALSNLCKMGFGGVFSGFIHQLILDGRPCLLPPQYNLIVRHRALASQQNTIVTIPTSTGKTLLGELIIAARIVGDGDIAIYVAPYIALGRQVFESIKKHAPSQVDVRGYFGNFNSHIDPLSPSGSTIIVATPERLDAILRTQPIYSRVRTIIFDEAHGIENGVSAVSTHETDRVG